VIELAVGVMESAAMGATTTPIAELSATAEALATIFALPGAVPVTIPFDDTVANRVSVELHESA